MHREPDETSTLIKDTPAESRPEPGHDDWLKRQLEQAVADLDDPDRVEIEHDEVFSKLDGIIAKHEVP